MSRNNEIFGKYLTFSLKGETYGVPIGSVREIISLSPITGVPSTPDFVVGVINLRGKIVPVIELRRKFGLEATEHTRETCIVVIDVDDVQVGVIVDTVREVIDLTRDQVEVAPQMGHDSGSKFLIGMGKQGEDVVILVDLYLCLSREFLRDVISAGTHATSRVA